MLCANRADDSWTRRQTRWHCRFRWTGTTSLRGSSRRACESRIGLTRKLAFTCAKKRAKSQRSRELDRCRLPARDDEHGRRQRMGQHLQIELERDVLRSVCRACESQRGGICGLRKGMQELRSRCRLLTDPDDWLGRDRPDQRCCMSFHVKGRGRVLSSQANPTEADISGKKRIQTRITHNDGGTWKPVNPPAKDSLGQEYDCRSTVSRSR
jgi:hypothetical protein